MKTQVGLWIDRREAVIVTLIDQTEEIEHITSDVEELVSDGDAPHVSQQDRHDKRVDAQLNKYYGKLINTMHNAGSILIFGPGEAKYEFQKKLERRGLSDHIVAIETTDSMTKAQVAEKVRQYFFD
jgi:stalled ribosome rescue protein Dom34